MEVTATAPGKLFLLGEYAVALGGPAVVAAVDRRLGCRIGRVAGPGRFTVRGARDEYTGSFSDETLDGVPDDFRFASAAVLLGVRHLQLRGMDLHIETWSELEESGVKLGLGGSAATVVAVLGGLYELGGRGSDREAIACLGVAAHRFAQGGGSGADVVACTLGGIHRISGLDVASETPAARASDCVPVAVSAHPMQLPSGLEFEVVGTGEPARTGPRLRRFLECAAGEGAWGEEGAGRVEAWVQAMSAAVARFEEGCRGGEPEPALRAYACARDLFDELGSLVGIRVWTAALRGACGVPLSDDAAAIKPSGAGGGDCAVALVRTESRDALRAAWADLGLRPLSLRANAQGVLAHAGPGELMDG